MVKRIESMNWRGDDICCGYVCGENLYLYHGGEFVIYPIHMAEVRDLGEDFWALI